MRLARPSFVVPLVLGAASFLVDGAPALDASGGKETFEDTQRGFRVTLGEKFEQVPPKLTPDTAYIVGDWYADAAKFRGADKPEFVIFWFAAPKAASITPKGDAKAPPKDAPPETPEERIKRIRQESIPKSMDQFLDQYFGANVRLFGGDVPSAKEIWKTAEKVKTKSPGVEALYAEVNDPEDKKGKKLNAAGRASQSCAVVAKVTLDRPGEVIEVGFLGYCPMEFWKKGRVEFKDAVKSFEDRAKIATDSRNLGAQQELDPEDPEAFRAAIHKTKVIKGWRAVDLPHYVVMHDTEVDPALAKKIGEQLESLRAQVYEVVFPPDKPVKAISLVRCCKDREQYLAYGGSPSSAGYWNWDGMELVFYEDRNKKEDSLRVLYHEGFHQFIHYSVGGKMDPHSWFNEGTGDYFFGFNCVGGKWTRGTNSWRKDIAKAAKREHNFPELREWLSWNQRQYYGENSFHLGGGENYALGWSFIYFLRTTKKPEYQGILERYFDTLKGCMTLARETKDADERAKKAAEEEAKRAAAEQAAKDAEEKAKKDAAPPAPAEPAKPAEGTKPADPAPPPDAAKPGETPKPADLPKPSDATPPIEPPKPDAPPTPPADPVKPVDPPKPADPAPAPVDPPKPADPATPPTPAPATPPADPTRPADPAKPAEPAKPADAPKPPEKPKEDPRHREIFNEMRWLDKALDAAFKGVDMKQLEKDWLNAD